MARAHNLGKGGERRRGERNGAAKLTVEKVRAMRKEYRAPGWRADGTWEPGNIGILAENYGVNRRNALAVIDGTTWGWLD